MQRKNISNKDAAIVTLNPMQLIRKVYMLGISGTITITRVYNTMDNNLIKVLPFIVFLSCCSSQKDYFTTENNFCKIFSFRETALCGQRAVARLIILMHAPSFYSFT